ncbi:MAG: hypothetical protein IKT70_02160 [Clostridia bacterium]|nr:hypothetical protein [Clostridia bacterium]
MTEDQNSHECMPIGLAVSLAQNIDAVNNFSLLTKEERASVLDKARRTTTKAEMIAIVSDIAKRNR